MKAPNKKGIPKNLQFHKDGLTANLAYHYPALRAKKKPLGLFQGALWYWATTYSPTGQGSTIGAAGLNFSVRNGKRCAPAL